MLPHFRANALAPPIVGAGGIRSAYPTRFMDAGLDGSAGNADDNIYIPGIGGEDEDYDAADLQNWFLAYMAAGTSTSSGIIPSFHRPEVLNFIHRYVILDFFASKGVTAAQENALYELPLGIDPLDPSDDPPGPLTIPERQELVALKRMHVLRPLFDDHPKFPIRTMADLKTGKWDVDTDGDGIVDSIWLDIGLPVSPGPDGRPRKPLVAILCRDLDGRLDLNVHSQFSHLPFEFDSAGRFNLNGYATISRGAGWGVDNFDDDGNGTVDDMREAMWPGSDDRYELAANTLTNSASSSTTIRLPRGASAGTGGSELRLDVPSIRIFQFIDGPLSVRSDLVRLAQRIFPSSRHTKRFRRFSFLRETSRLAAQLGNQSRIASVEPSNRSANNIWIRLMARCPGRNQHLSGSSRLAAQ